MIDLIGIIIAAVLIAFVLLLIFLPAVAWSVLGFLIFALIFLLLIPVGLEISYLGSKFKLALKIWFYSHILLFNTLIKSYSGSLNSPQLNISFSTLKLLTRLIVSHI